MGSEYRGWGFKPSSRQKVKKLFWRNENFNDIEGPVLAYGNGRSYGDSCLNSKGTLLDLRGMNRFIEFDESSGILRCESGMTFADILDVIVPRGWFLPVTPGTKYVTVGGAVANDVHGKNHHRDGTLGRHILCFELIRSDGQRLYCSHSENSGMFSATIGGLGLTGLISWVEIQLIPIPSPFLDVQTIVFRSIEHFREISAESHDKYQYTVAWLDCLSQGKGFGRGLFMRANHVESTKKDHNLIPKKHNLNVPFAFPKHFLNKYTIKTLNESYFMLNSRQSKQQVRQYFDPFFYPLDSIDNWNRIYGSNGFFQYQFVVPEVGGRPIENILRLIVEAEAGSFLAVLKVFGNLSSPGMLSFPREGICLALDFPNRGEKTKKLLDELDKHVIDMGGVVYPAKDVRMSAQSFSAYYPDLEVFKPYIDDKFTSDFWRRVTKSYEM